MKKARRMLNIWKKADPFGVDVRIRKEIPIKSERERGKGFARNEASRIYSGSETTSIS